MRASDEAVAVAVVATIARERLPSALSAIHRGGFGHVTRVIDPRRGDAVGQLRRAGAVVPPGFALDPATDVAVLVTAPGRAERAAALLQAYGAGSIVLTDRPAPAATASAGSAARDRPADEITD